MSKSDLYKKTGLTTDGVEVNKIEMAKDINKRPHSKGKERKHFYGTYTWKKVRETKVKLNPICERCKPLGKYAPTKLVHHIRPIEDGGNLYDFDNLMSLCSELCHAAEHSEIEQRRRDGTLGWT